ncbi:MAG: excisionase family DNA-binding protein [Zoogloea sp.]|nr:excisionase family DNA-binding protein [Zoogloea sp.]
MSENRETPEKEYCSTTEAAQRLGLSLGTVQQMVENGILEGWKTAGGHRRIRVASVESFLSRAASGGALPGPRSSGMLHVVIAEDDAILQKLYEHTVGSWDMPLQVKIVGSGFEGLIEIGRSVPDLLICDLLMPGMDGFEMIRRLRADSRLAEMDIVVVSGLSPEDIEERGGLPADVTRYGKPVPFHELRGFIQAKVSALQRRRSS